MFFLTVVSSSFSCLSFSHHPFFSRNEHGRVRQAKYSTTLDHHQRPTSNHSGEKVNILIARPSRMKPTAIKDSHTSQRKFADVSLV